MAQRGACRVVRPAYDRFGPRVPRFLGERRGGLRERRPLPRPDGRDSTQVQVPRRSPLDFSPFPAFLPWHGAASSGARPGRKGRDGDGQRHSAEGPFSLPHVHPAEVHRRLSRVFELNVLGARGRERRGVPAQGERRSGRGGHGGPRRPAPRRQLHRGGGVRPLSDARRGQRDSSRPLQPPAPQPAKGLLPGASGPPLDSRGAAAQQGLRVRLLAKAGAIPTGLRNPTGKSPPLLSSLAVF